jgi:predicted nucleic acid-binding protein
MENISRRGPSVSIVIDASICLAWLYADEAGTKAEAVYDFIRRSGAVVPPVWRFEIANSLQQSVWRRRIDTGFRDASLADLSRLNIHVDTECDAVAWTSTLNLADRFRLTTYDASYLELAQRRGLPLATLDRTLGSAARRLAVELLLN